ncbi:MAG TPA: hypothetical protein VLI04_19620 [Nocardioidaceae bacterium]|nr:hypothetical protein [Nocardioidaceae bacterium]
MKKTLALAAAPVALFIAFSGPAEAGPNRSTATLSVTTAGSGAGTASTAMKVGSSLVFGGCGYAPGTGVTFVVVSPAATSFFGGPADANGCVSSANSEVYYARVAGSYSAKAYQSSNKRADAAVTFSVAP